MDGGGSGRPARKRDRPVVHCRRSNLLSGGADLTEADLTGAEGITAEELEEQEWCPEYLCG